MKSLIWIFILLCLAAFNANNASAFVEGTTFWYKHASHGELVRHYKKMELDEKCAMWKRVGYWKQKRRIPNRNAIKDALRSEGADPFICMKLQSP